MLTCPICGKEFKNSSGLKLHMAAKHPDEVLNEGTQASEKIIQPTVMNEKKEIQEVVDKKEDEFVSVNESIDTDFVTKKTNPYKDLYPAEGEVINEWC